MAENYIQRFFNRKKLKEMDTSSNLVTFCQICQQNGIQSYFINGKHKGSVKNFPCNDLSSRQNCPFCRLLLNLLAEAAGLNMTEIDHCELELPQTSRPEISIGLTTGHKLDLRIYIDEINPSDVKHDWIQYSGPQINMLKLHGALMFCTEFHQTCNGLDKRVLKDIDNLLLIDVKRQCLVYETSAARYITLSYTWGQIKSFKTLLSNVTHLKEVGSLMNIWNELSVTITDAILLVQNLGERYLWVSG
jgi:hypothetical protein